MTLLEDVVHLVRKVEPTFLTEESSQGLKNKETQAAHAIESVGQAVHDLAITPLEEADEKIRLQTPTRQLKQPIHSPIEKLLIALNSLSDKNDSQ